MIEKKKSCEKIKLIFASIMAIIAVLLLISSARMYTIPTLSAQRTPIHVAQRSKTDVARGDAITIKGAVTGDVDMDKVDIVIVGHKEFTKDKIGVENGFVLTTSRIGGKGEFEKMIDVPERAYTGVYYSCVNTRALMGYMIIPQQGMVS